MNRGLLFYSIAFALFGCGPKQQPASAPTPDPDAVADSVEAAEPEEELPIHELVNGAVATLEKAAPQPAEIQKAIEALDKARGREPANASIRLNLGVARQLLGDTVEAQREYQAAVEVDPSQGRAWLHLGQLALEEGRESQAESTWATGIRNAPADMDLRVALIDLLRTSGRLDDAIREAKAALQENANSLEVYNAMGLCWQDKGDLVLARFVYQKALAGIPGADENAWLHLNLGWTYYLDGRTPNAVEELKRALELDPYLIPALINLSRIYMDDRNYEDTIPLLERARDRAPDDPGVHVNLGIAYRGMGRYPDAEAAYRKALELRPSDPSPYMNLGILFGDYTKDYDASVEAFDVYINSAGPQAALATEYRDLVLKEQKRVEKRKKAEADRKKREAERAEQKRLAAEAEKKRKAEERRQKQEADPWGAGTEEAPSEPEGDAPVEEPGGDEPAPEGESAEPEPTGGSAWDDQ